MRYRLILPVLLLVAIAGFWWRNHGPHQLGEGYVSEHSATLWSSVAQVKQPVATLHYGERVAVLQRHGVQTQVRTSQGRTGWLDTRLLMEPGLWRQSESLLARVQAMPVQAHGRTKAVSNVRVEPGRAAARIYQFTRGAPVEVLARAVAEVRAAEQSPAGKPAEDEKPRREDWLLVSGRAASRLVTTASENGFARPESSGGTARSEEMLPVAGWVLARFVGLDTPGAIRDYASSSGMRVIAWFELNRVPGAGDERPQYLVAGVHGGEGQPCDFTLLRVYTWGSKRNRYETAYVESNLCGRLPIRVDKTTSGDPEFRFTATGKSGDERRRYVMRQTVVRRVRDVEPGARRAPRRSR